MAFHTFHSGLPFGGRDILCAMAIVLAVIVLGAPGITEGGLGWSDAPNHTFDGIFVLEYAKACLKQSQLVLDPGAFRDWAEQFYIRYPALGIIVYWPPGFAVVEAVVYAVFGVNIVAARATVLLFAIGAGLLMFSLGKRWFDRPTGLLASLLLIACPHGALWLSDVMLEWPATFWILAAVWTYQKDRDTRKRRWSIIMAAAILAAFMTKQTAGFIAPVLVIHALLSLDRRTYLLRSRFLVSLAVAVVIIAGYGLATRSHTALPAQLLRPSLDVSFYARHLPEIIGWPLLPIALLGLGTFIVGPDRSARGLLLIWFAAWVVFCSVISAKEPRYFFFALPPLAFAAVRFFVPHRGVPLGGRSIGCACRDGPTRSAHPASIEQALCRKHDTPRLVLLTALVVTQTILAHTKSTGRLPTYAAAVAELAAKHDADLVLVDAVRDGQFVFDFYQNPAARNKIIPLRASKLLYARAARMEYAPQVFVKTEHDIIDLLDRYGIRYVVIESALPKTHYTDADPPPRKLLRNLLATDARFNLVKTWPLRCDDPLWDNVELRLYAYPGCPARTSDVITLSFPAMDREITFKLP
ncbi:MAG: glycosyltransferase family 39 protein [Phycisphaerae bacterium]|nr:glycosyltransferase family 39 protein [Phycisphaerae bacterium]